MFMKKCNKCGIEKKLIDFSKDKNKKDGLATICKDCHSKYRHYNYIENYQ